MLQAHFDAQEQALLQISKIPANAGHMLHRGTPREAFIKEFLSNHLSTNLAIGSGEIIDSASLPREPRNQFDIVIFDPRFPKIALGAGINAFLAETVLATIEIKSQLTKQDLDTATVSTNKVKKLKRHFGGSVSSGYIPPGIISYVIAYDGPAQIETVFSWLKQIETAHGINCKALPLDPEHRLSTPSEGVDGIFMLGKGGILFDNSPLSFAGNALRSQRPMNKYFVLNQITNNLLLLFLHLTIAGANWSTRQPELIEYLKEVKFNTIFSP